MFSINDIYTSSGSVKLYNCWTDKVTKHDSSSFYNWEQDNLPIYDLDERTTYLWEQLGFPTSSIPGIALVVSADAPASAIGCSKNIYTSVSALVEAIPKIINFPILIEIANFGQLNDLKLGNLKFGPRGSLEIINRNFAKSDSSYNPQIDSITSGIIDTQASYSKYQFVSGVSGSHTPAGLSLSSDFGARGQFIDTSCVSISAPVFSSVTDVRLSALNGYVAGPSLYALNRATLVIGTGSDSPYGENNGSNARILNFKAYEFNPNSSDQINSKDVSTTNLFDSTHMYFTNTNFVGTSNANVTKEKNGLFYGNKIKKIQITNCDGPIFIRNFFVDGSGSLVADNDYGIEINNCPRIYLENIVSTRNRKAGFYINNSNVTLLRGCVGTRNYDFTSNNSSRIIDSWNRRIYNVVSGVSEDIGAGLIANNSVVTVSSTSSMEYSNIINAILSKLKKETGNTYTENEVTSIYNFIRPNYLTTFEFTRNTNGIILNNSVFTGGAGDQTVASEAATPLTNINLVIEGNTSHGIKSKNSTISWSGRLFCYENMFGLTCESTLLELDKSFISLNQQKGMTLLNSTLRYNKDKIPVRYSVDRNNHYVFSGNGQHIYMSNSHMYPTECSGMPDVYGKMKFVFPIGLAYTIVGARKGIKSGVELANNSEAILIHPFFERTTAQSVSGSYCRGSELLVNNSSKAVLKGSKNYATKIFGPDEVGHHTKYAGVYASLNSIVEFNGPTVVGQYGVDILAEDNSVVNINPHLVAGGGLDISGFNLDDKFNHTAVELHSTRSCVVVNKNSSFNIRDLGSYIKNYNKTQTGVDAAAGSDYPLGSYDIDQYVSGGSIQFFPNPHPEGALNVYISQGGTGNNGVEDFGDYTTNDSFSFNSNRDMLYFHPAGATLATANGYSSITNGGWCVRAVNDSLINIFNVNFPCGWWNASGIIYTCNTNLCDRLFMWNIADSSKIRASWVSVSGNYPRVAGYYGPSGDWGNSGLPSSTPDTSSISVLDYFGKTTRNPYGSQVSASNFGPFRLYFGVDPVTNFFNYSGVADVDQPLNTYQIYSQGYQPSSYVSATVISYDQVSATHRSIMQRQLNGSITTSGYFYGSSIVSDPNTTKAYLDKSAAETFANAKHCSTGKSGNAKICQIFYPTALAGGDSIVRPGGIGLLSVNEFELERNN